MPDQHDRQYKACAALMKAEGDKKVLGAEEADGMIRRFQKHQIKKDRVSQQDSARRVAFGE